MTDLVRILVAILVAAVVVWLLLDVAALPGVIVALAALIAFLVIAFGDGLLRR